MRILKYVEQARCTSRESEITSGKTDKRLKLDSGTLSVRESRTIPDETVSTTCNWATCLRRRGIAYDFANLISFTAHELYVERLLRHLSIEPPPAFQAVTLAQVLRADKEVFTHMAHNVVDIRPDANDERPLDKALHEALKDYNTAFHLMPLPKHAVKDEAGPSNRKYAAEPCTTYTVHRKAKEKASVRRGAKALVQMPLPRDMLVVWVVMERDAAWTAWSSIPVEGLVESGPRDDRPNWASH